MRPVARPLRGNAQAGEGQEQEWEETFHWAVVQVLQGGEVTDTLSLGKNVTRRYESGNGGYNIVEVREGKVSVTEASCPDKVCVNHGPTDQTADPIVCLPNKLVVRVLAPGDDPNQLDGVSS